MRKNISGQIVAFQAISSTDGSDVTTGSPVVYYTIDGGTQAQTTASAVHEGNGQWTVALTQAETNGDHIAFSFVLTGAISQTLNVYTINADITNLDAAISSRSTFNSASDQVTVATNNDKTGYSISGTKTTLDALNDIAATDIVSGGAITTSGGAVSNVTLVATTTTNTDMRGTDGANTVAPDNASIAAILVDTGTDIPASIAALNNFDPATDTVANVTTVASVTNPVATDTASRDASKADVSALATTADLAVVDGNVDAIKAKTDQLAFTVANQVDANALTGGGGDDAATIYSYFTSGTNEDAFKADVTGLSTFDPTTDQVVVGTNNDKTGYALSSAANDAIGAAFLAYTLTKGTAGTIERAFWQSLKATQLTDGEVSGTPTSSAFDTNLTAVTGAYDHLLLLFTSGSLAGEARPIETYNATNGRITLQEPLTAAPSSSDEFIVVPDHSHPVSEIVEGIFNEPQAGYTTAGTFGYYLDSQVSAAGGAVDTAAIADAVWDESRAGHTTANTFGYFLDAQVSSAGAGGTGLYQVSVLVQDASNNALQGARINVDGTTLTLTTDSSGIVTFNLDSGVYLLTCSPPAGYDTPSSISAIVTTADLSKEFTLTPTSSAPCDVPWVG